MGKYYKDEHIYDDIINLPHHRSKNRTPMSLHDRAAQFAPFMALSGYEEAIEETERLTEAEIELDASVVEEINRKLYEISLHLREQRCVSITYFKPDGLKAGGSYLTDAGTIRKIDTNEQMVYMDNGVRIPMKQILSIELQ